MHDLGITYDSSTFDTDPFEPQPEGVCTVFPFWIVNRHATKAFVELPYTLPQDLTLFVMLQEKTIEIWKRKLDWVAEKGGMALLITHPDYLCFGDKEPGLEEYPVRYYQELLEYIQDKYAGQYWQALPRKVVEYFASVYPKEQKLQEAAETNRQPLRVCMSTHSFYESDMRVRRYAESLARRGDHVDVFSLRRDGRENRELLKGVHVHRIQKRVKNEAGPFSYLARTTLFLLRSTIAISAREMRGHYNLVHAHNIPDSQVFSAILPKLRGAKVILDIHDIVPELFCSKFGKRPDSSYFSAIQNLERASARFSDHVIVANDLWGKKLIQRSVPPEKCSVLLNYPDLSIFSRDAGAAVHSGKPTVIYPGSLNHHQGVDLAVEAFARIAEDVPDARFLIYGEGPARDTLIRQIRESRLSDKIFMKDMLPLEGLAPIMARATIGVVPKRAEGFGDEAFSTKILEFMALGVPVLVSSTTIDRYYFDESVVLFFESGNAADLAEKMLLLLENEGLRRKLSERGLDFVRANNWDVKKSIYLDLVDRLTASEPRRLQEHEEPQIRES